MLDESALVLEGVTLAQVVELVVKVLVDLAGGAVLDQKTAEDTETAHPHDLAVVVSSVAARWDEVGERAGIPGHTGVLGTLSLTETTVATDAASGGQLTGAGARVHGDGLADDEAIGDELADGLAGVGVGDLVDLVGVEPDLSLAAANDRGRQALLGAKVDPVARRMSVPVLLDCGGAFLPPGRALDRGATAAAGAGRCNFGCNRRSTLSRDGGLMILTF